MAGQNFTLKRKEQNLPKEGERDKVNVKVMAYRPERETMEPSNEVEETNNQLFLEREEQKRIDVGG